MAARIGELLTREQQVRDARAREACRKECSDLICRLRTAREQRDPQSIWNNINRNLEVLVNAGDHNYWFRQPKKAPVLDSRCDLKGIDRDGLMQRLIALNDEQHKILLLLGTDDLVEQDDVPQGPDQSLIDRLFGLREQVLNELPKEKGWRGKLNEAAMRDERLAVLCGQFRSLGRESQRVVKELEARG